MYLSSIWQYPVKSCRGISLQIAQIDLFGVVGDRRFVVADLEGKALTQKTSPRLNLIAVDVTGQRLRLTAPGRSDLLVDIRQSGTPVTVNIHGSAPGECLGPAAQAWLTELLGRPCRLVRNTGAYVRHIHPLAAHLFLPIQRGFPDCAPILLTGLGSLAELSGRAGTSIEMSRFRPNLAVHGAAPYAEDNWRVIRVGDVDFEFMGPCERCGVTLVIPESEKRSHEPLLTLRTYRKTTTGLAGGILFGSYFKPITSGFISAGDEIRVLEAKDGYA